MNWKLYLYEVETDKGMMDIKIKQWCPLAMQDTVRDFVHTRYPWLTIKNITFKGAVSNA